MSLRRRLVQSLVLLAALAALGLPAAAQTRYPTLAPYEDILWPADGTLAPLVRLGTQRYVLTSIDGTPVDSIVAFAQRTYETLWQKRFDEDLVEVLLRMGRPPGPTVALGLREPETGRELAVPAARMDRNNRQRIRDARELRAAGLEPPEPFVRPERLSADEIARDLDAFQSEIEARWAYLETTGVDYRGAIAELKARAPSGLAYDRYGVELERIVARFIDGHAGVGGVRYPGGLLPFILEASGGRYVAVARDRSGLVDAEYPYLRASDGLPVERWMDAAKAFGPNGSRQRREENALVMVRRIQFLREELGRPTSDSATVELESANGTARPAPLVVPLPASAPTPIGWPATESGVLDGNVGYLRLASFSESPVYDPVAEIATWMPRFRDTRGLIVDVRGNSGGTRDGLRALFPYFMTQSDPPLVVNAARYRLHPEYREDHLGGSRFMYVQSWPGWSAEERTAIAGFRAGFTPEWSPPADKFSDWHYLVLSRGMNPQAYPYERPVVVLMDGGSFSATDIFVSALKGWRNVTLVGSPSGGGSARQVSIELPVSHLTVTLASMASFQRSGLMFDGHGTEPDVRVDPEPGAFVPGGRDTALIRALELLR